jgi:hypothetical protein
MSAGMGQETGYFIVEPCNSSGGFEIKLRERKLDLKKCEIALSKLGAVVGNTGVVLLAKVDDFSLSVYGSGRMMLKCKRRPKKEEADAFAQKLMSELEKAGAVV